MMHRTDLCPFACGWNQIGANKEEEVHFRMSRDTNCSISRLDAAEPFQLWLADLSATPEDEEIELLTDREKNRAASFVFSRDRMRYLSAHCALRIVLSRHMRSEHQYLDIYEQPFGKPAVAGLKSGSFNMSHCQDFGLIAISDSDEIGVDIEVIRPVKDAVDLAQHVFTQGEISTLTSAKIHEVDQAFLTGWTRKEACLKAIGTGLRLPPKTFEVGLHPDCRVIQVADGYENHTLEVRSFLHASGFVGSVARLCELCP